MPVRGGDETDAAVTARHPLDSLVAGNQMLLMEIVWPHFWAIQIILVVLILMYCTMHELVRVIGRDKVLEIFFGTPHATRRSWELPP